MIKLFSTTQKLSLVQVLDVNFTPLLHSGANFRVLLVPVVCFIVQIVVLVGMNQ
jgi:hypothetical protein